ncbi:hypothetical protein CP965_10355 [Halarcobacter mediterraneus]|uniref:Uncharacterized protein n=1 Tax=Halarcobacter mediterraneus TaxID=2023153 RepID=A0A4Q1AX78_9BACT|nr:hypothetical protein [Halarcobacter mediterraneus]RXK12171.1 hypothetical protein CP965_10355 [Halarcobacter mediterraneus]
MKLVSNKKSKTLFLSSSSKFLNIEEKVNIIISPEFYWIRKFEIPVKTEKQAKLILPTLFEDIIEEDSSELVYQVKKIEENLYLGFAFDNGKIFEAIKKSGINVSNIDSLYFAQIECKDISSFSSANQNFIYTQDNILVKLPSNLPVDNSPIDNKLDKIDLSSFKVNIKLYNSAILNSKNLSFIYTFFILLALVNFIKYFSYKLETNNIEENLEKISKASSLPSSKIQTNAIINKYKSTIEFENKKREIISYFVSNSSLGLNFFEMDNNSLSFYFNAKNKTKIESYIKKKYKISSSKVVSNNLIVSISI